MAPKKKSKTKKSKKKNKSWEFTGLLILVLIAVFMVVLFLLLQLYRDYTRLSQDIFNVKETVDFNQSGKVQAVAQDLNELKKKIQEDDKKSPELHAQQYINATIGLSFDLPFKDNKPPVLIEDNNFIWFGPLIAGKRNTVPQPQYKLVSFPETTITQYRDRLIFPKEDCPEKQTCITLKPPAEDFEDSRDAAIDTILREQTIGSVATRLFLAQDGCQQPYALFFNESRQTLYQLSETCQTVPDDRFKNLSEVIQSVTFVD